MLTLCNSSFEFIKRQFWQEVWNLKRQNKYTISFCEMSSECLAYLKEVQSLCI